MPNGFENCHFEESGDNSEPISFKQGLEDFFGSFVRYNLDSRQETVENAIPATMGVLARCSDQDIKAYEAYEA